MRRVVRIQRRADRRTEWGLGREAERMFESRASPPLYSARRALCNHRPFSVPAPPPSSCSAPSKLPPSLGFSFAPVILYTTVTFPCDTGLRRTRPCSEDHAIVFNTGYTATPWRQTQKAANISASSRPARYVSSRNTSDPSREQHPSENFHRRWA